MIDLLDDLKTLILTRHPIVTIRTLDEEFATRTIHQVGLELGLTVIEWSVADGIRRAVPDRGESLGNTETLAGALRYMRSNSRNNIYILKDAIGHLNNPQAMRLLRDVAAEYARDGRIIFMLDADGEVPAALHSVCVPHELSPPDAREVRNLVKKTVRELTQLGQGTVDMTRSQLRQFLTNLRGLTRTEVSRAVSESILRDGQLGPEDIEHVIEIKRRRLRQTGVLDYIPPPKVKPRVGGMNRLRKWLTQRAKAFTPEAREYGLDPPRGILMLGVQGCGKSLMARFVAAKWRLPLLRMDVGALFDKYVGETERHLRQAFETASAMSPCVLWIDEVEKAFASATAGADGARSDGGLSQRLFGQLLTWMQDRDDPAFLVATANDVSALPPELMRKGRFDEIFFVDLPGPAARRTILKIHLLKRRRDPKEFGLDALTEAAEGFSGAEIEQAIVAAMYAAFAEKRQLATEDILTEIGATSPLSVVMAEKVDALRAWATGRCVMAD